MTVYVPFYLINPQDPDYPTHYDPADRSENQPVCEPCADALGVGATYSGGWIGPDDIDFPCVRCGEMIAAKALLDE